MRVESHLFLQIMHMNPGSTEHKSPQPAGWTYLGNIPGYYWDEEKKKYSKITIVKAIEVS